MSQTSCGLFFCCTRVCGGSACALRKVAWQCLLGWVDAEELLSSLPQRQVIECLGCHSSWGVQHKASVTRIDTSNRQRRIDKVGMGFSMTRIDTSNRQRRIDKVGCQAIPDKVNHPDSSCSIHSICGTCGSTPGMLQNTGKQQEFS